MIKLHDMDNPKYVLNFVSKTLESMKADKVTLLNVSKHTPLMDYMVLCNANSKRHAKAIGEKLVTEAKQQKLSLLGVEGEQESEWILVDMVYVVVHIMLREVRDFYRLEDLWSESL